MCIAVCLCCLQPDVAVINHCHSRQPPSGNGLSVHLDSGNPDRTRSSWEAAVYVAAGQDPFYLCDVAIAAAAHVAGDLHA